MMAFFAHEKTHARRRTDSAGVEPAGRSQVTQQRARVCRRGAVPGKGSIGVNETVSDDRQAATTAAPQNVCAPDEVVVLLALYHSEKYLTEQLTSIAGQSHRAWSLEVSDDGPCPASVSALQSFEARHPHRRIRYRVGPGEGFAANFLSLLARAPQDAPYVALCDHDDVWFSDKLARGVAALSAVPDDVPTLYGARTVVCDEALTPKGLSSRFTRPFGFRNALVQSMAGGNTMMLNRAGLALARAAAAEAGQIVAHDWWLYQIVSGAGGRILYDPEPVLYYRQHERNAIGANRALKARTARLRAILKGRFRRWNRINLASLARSAHRFTPEARACLTHYAQVHEGGLARKVAALRAAGVYRQSTAGNIALWVACLTGKM
ncbi:glycosyltransferase [Rhodobacteraceae bacterium CCMM004]|nr:glycosyltransferase [Rhodobacteraceae bacterium CCMM004]